MNWIEIEGRWSELKLGLRQHWPRLTPDDVRALGPRREFLVGKLRERYGLSREHAERWVERWMQQLGAKPTRASCDEDARENTTRVMHVAGAAEGIAR